MAVVLLGSLVGPLAPAARADDPRNVVTIDHTPPPTVIAGDAAPLSATFRYTCPLLSECRNATQRLVYFVADGTTRSIERFVARPTAVEPWTVTVPGDAVRHPQLRYHFEVDFDVYWTGQEHTDRYSDRSPVTGEHTASVTTRLRFTLTKPDGSPASNVKLSYMIEGSTADAAWLQADSLGRVVFNVPMTNPTLAATASTTGYGIINVLAFNNFPTTALAAPTNITGLGTVLMLQVNTGNRRLGAVQSSVQDATIPLVPMSVPFEPRTASSQPGVTTGSSRYEDVRHDAIVNVGGAQDWYTAFAYSDSVSTSSTFLFESGSGWEESKAEVSKKEEHTTQSWIERGPYYALCDPSSGGNWQAWCWNNRFSMVWDFVEESVLVCWGGWPAATCWRNKRIVPDTMKHALADPVPDAHNAVTRGPDCLLRVGLDKYTVSVGKTRSVPVEFGLGWEPKLPKAVHMGVNLRREDSHANSTEYEWHVDIAMDKVNGGPRYHYLFVKNGLSDANNKACPATHPDQAWTASTTEDLASGLPGA